MLSSLPRVSSPASLQQICSSRLKFTGALAIDIILEPVAPAQKQVCYLVTDNLIVGFSDINQLLSLKCHDLLRIGHLASSQQPLVEHIQKLRPMRVLCNFNSDDLIFPNPFPSRACIRPLADFFFYKVSCTFHCYPYHDEVPFYGDTTSFGIIPIRNAENELFTVPILGKCINSPYYYNFLCCDDPLCDKLSLVDLLRIYMHWSRTFLAERRHVRQAYNVHRQLHRDRHLRTISLFDRFARDHFPETTRYGGNSRSYGWWTGDGRNRLSWRRRN